jgi:hypothetical protein
MAFADLELPYIPFHFPKTATEASRAFPQSRADAAGSLLAEVVPILLLARAVFH